MNTLRTTISRSLRSKHLLPSSQISKVGTRAITLTTRKSTTTINHETPQNQNPTPFIPHSFSHQNQPPNPFTTLTHHLTTHLSSHPSPSLPHLTTLLRSYRSTPTDWSPYYHPNPTKQYTRNLVASIPGVFNLLLLVWTPGRRSPVHDHAGAHCLMRVLRGGLRERLWVMPDSADSDSGEEKGMMEIGRRVLKEGMVGYMSDEMGVHEISNPSTTEYAVSLHLYTPPHASTKGCRVFDPQSGEARTVMQGEWDSEYGVPILRT